MGSLIRHALPIVIAPRTENGLEFIGGLFHFVFPAQLDGFALCGGDLMAPTDPSPLRGAPLPRLCPFPNMAQGVKWAFKISIRCIRLVGCLRE